MRLKKIVINVIAFFIGKGLQATVRMDAGVREEMMDWVDGYTIVIETYTHGPKICFRKSGKRLLVQKYEEGMSVDIHIGFKSTQIVYELFTGTLGLDQAYAENRMVIKGDIFQTLRVVRMFYACECYLFPKFIWRKIIPVKPTLESGTLQVYTATLLGMK